MGSGKRFNLTDKRKREVIRLLQQQYSITLIAQLWNISPDILGQRIKEANIDYKLQQSEGIRLLKANMFAELSDVDETDKRIKLTLDVLKHYDKSDDVAKDEVTIKYASMDDFYEDAK